MTRNPRTIPPEMLASEAVALSSTAIRRRSRCCSSPRATSPSASCMCTIFCKPVLFKIQIVPLTGTSRDACSICCIKQQLRRVIHAISMRLLPLYSRSAPSAAPASLSVCGTGRLRATRRQTLQSTATAFYAAGWLMPDRARPIMFAKRWSAICLRRLPIYVGGVINTLAVSAAIAAYMQTPPFIAWFAVEVVICITRFAVCLSQARAQRWIGDRRRPICIFSSRSPGA